MSKSRITYRFEQPSPSKREGFQEKGKIIPLRQEEYRVYTSPEPIIDPQPLNEFTKDFGAWNSPFDTETEELERIIRETNEPPKSNRTRETNESRSNHRSEVNNSQQSNDKSEANESPQSSYFDDNKLDRYDESTGYYDPNLDPKYRDFIRAEMSASRYIRRSKKPWAKIITSVSGAVITGVVFGMFVLSLFTDSGESIKDVTKNGIMNDDGSTVISLPAENSDSSDVSIPDSIGTMSVNIPEQSFFVLQNGLFNSIEGAEAAKQELTSKGYAAVSEAAEGYYVYAGISTNRDDALLISHQLQQHDIEIYIRTYTNPAIRSIYWQGEPTEVFEEYFIQGNQLAEMISNLSLLHLQQPSASAIENSSMNTLLEDHQSWNSLSSQVYEGIPDDLKPNLQKLNNAMNTTMISLEAYKKNPSFSFLWQTQTALIQYIVLQTELLNSLEVK